MAKDIDMKDVLDIIRNAGPLPAGPPVDVEDMLKGIITFVTSTQTLSHITTTRSTPRRTLSPTASALRNCPNTFIKKKIAVKNWEFNQPQWSIQQYADKLEQAKQQHKDLCLLTAHDGTSISSAGTTHLGLCFYDNAGNKRDTPQKITAPTKAELGAKQLRLQDEELRRIVEVYIFFYGELYAEVTSRILDGLYEGGCKREACDWMGRYRSGAQKQTLDQLTLSASAMLEHIGDGDLDKGIELWQAASKEEQAALLQEKFDEAPVHISQNVFPIESNAVNFTTIFCHPNAKATKPWRIFVTSKFVNLTMKVIEDRVIPKQWGNNVAKREGDQRLFDYWKTFSPDIRYASRDLRRLKVKDVPTWAIRREGKAGEKLIQRKERGSGRIAKPGGRMGRSTPLRALRKIQGSKFPAELLASRYGERDASSVG